MADGQAARQRGLKLARARLWRTDDCDWLLDHAVQMTGRELFAGQSLLITSAGRECRNRCRLQGDPATSPSRNIGEGKGGFLLKTYCIAYVATGLVFLAIDAIWLTLATQRLYRPLMGEMLAESFRFVPAMLFYLIYIAGIVVFAIAPALASDRWTTAAAYGAFLGLFAYATYDLTNQATLRDWPVMITIIDMVWGTLLTAFAATIGFLITRALSSP
jgi:uncharacterized membrane protein